MEFQYQKLLHDNLQIVASNPLSRYWQKQQIKKQYAKAARTGGAKTAKTAAENTKKMEKKSAEAAKTAEFAAKHWKGILIAIAALLLFIMIVAGVSSCASMFSESATIQKLNKIRKKRSGFKMRIILFVRSKKN